LHTSRLPYDAGTTSQVRQTTERANRENTKSVLRAVLRVGSYASSHFELAMAQMEQCRVQLRARATRRRIERSSYYDTKTTADAAFSLIKDPVQRINWNDLEFVMDLIMSCWTRPYLMDASPLKPPRLVPCRSSLELFTNRARRFLACEGG
jgi:hypothetical protein